MAIAQERGEMGNASECETEAGSDVEKNQCAGVQIHPNLNQLTSKIVLNKC